MRRGKQKLNALWNALDEAAFGAERILNLRESLPSAIEARARAEAWLRGRQVAKPEEVLIITGRGNQSAGGVGVIRQEILEMLPSLRRRGIVESWREHSPGSIVVKLAPTSALFSAAKRRRDTPPSNNAHSGAAIAGLEAETVSMLRQLALVNLEALGVDSGEPFVRAEMERIFSILSSAIPEGERSEAALKASMRNAIEEASDSGHKNDSGSRQKL
jgi:hypothetical protein